MKRLGLVLAGLALVGAVNTADAQLTMQMGNGWSATFAGNVNAFWIYTDNQSLVGPDEFETSSKLNGIGTGLLPAFFTFEAKGKEGDTDLGVHFGFAPQVSSGRNVASSFGTDAAGAQIDMRQVYLTVGGGWGQILAGKELGLFERQAILTDMTLFGAGVNVGFRGTALGRIGYGYLYADFRAQFTYSTPAGKTFGLSVGLFEPTTTGASAFAYTYGDTPRFEAEITVKPKLGKDTNTLLLWADGMYGHVKCAAVDSDCSDPTNPGISTTGVALGAKLDIGGFSFMASGFTAQGLGSLFEGDAYLSGGFTGDGTDVFGNAKTSQGYIIQGMYTFPGGKLGLGLSYGGNKLKLTDEEKSIPGGTVGQFASRSAWVGQVTYHWTKSLRVVGEYTNFDAKAYDEVSEDSSVKVAKGNQFAIGMMLFY